MPPLFQTRLLFYYKCIPCRSLAFLKSIKCTYCETFVRVLRVHMNFSDVSVQMPDELDLTALRGRGMQPGEEELPEAASPCMY